MCSVIINSKISIIRVNCSQRQPNAVLKETSKDTRCGTATLHCPQGKVEHVIAKEGWKQTNRRKEEQNTSWNSFEIHLRDVDTKR